MADESKYGRKGQKWHPVFIEYMEFIANHEVYKGMPDALVEDNKIQWEAPSNRKSGKFKDTHHKRRKWWREKAVSIGIDPNSANWISRTAKLIHPTQQKPCKRCGQVMELRYVYPSLILLKQLENLKYVDETFLFEPLETIQSLITRLFTRFSKDICSDLKRILETSSIKIPPLNPNLEDWISWIEKEYISLEPNKLSPGAMSNAPDRFDGFHSFNKCCRSQADKGRHLSNLKSYTTDRRVFEYWTEGDWITADRLMGKVRTDFASEPCLNGHLGPCSADHIGPISLGFTHRPEFQLLCKSCNSAKNNRMTLRDVLYLQQVEADGEKVISWHSQALWDARKKDVVDDETALRLSKLLRDNRHTLMKIFQRIEKAGHYTFLATFLHLEEAEHEVEFVNLRIENYLTIFDNINLKYRKTKYVKEQKARRFRVAFQSLQEYFTKENRNAFVITSPEIDRQVNAALSVLQQAGQTIQELDSEIATLLGSDALITVEQKYLEIVEKIPLTEQPKFRQAKQKLKQAMVMVASELSNRWNNERYIRTNLDLDSLL